MTRVQLTLREMAVLRLVAAGKPIGVPFTNS
jgi:DNA-binding CsgD family transcriptional regulator